jgi:hypothetical protein
MQARVDLRPVNLLESTPTHQFHCRLVSIIDRHAGSRQLAKFASKNFFQKSSIKRDGPVFF